ncbi:MAG: hypothetical protein IKK34_10900 [Clostridia bacterium]|nr:hypothetical protein [Clostridia bacterium]
MVLLYGREKRMSRRDWLKGGECGGTDAEEADGNLKKLPLGRRLLCKVDEGKTENSECMGSGTIGLLLFEENIDICETNY